MNSKDTIPRPIAETLNQVIERHRAGERRFNIGGWATLGLSAVVVLVGIDWIWVVESAEMRIGGVCVSVAVVAILSYVWWRFSERPLSLLEAAWRVEAVYHRFDERLITTIELIEQDGREWARKTGDCSPQLLDAVSSEAAREIEQVDAYAVPVRSNRGVVAMLAAVVVALLCMTALDPIGVADSLGQWLLPWRKSAVSQTALARVLTEQTLTAVNDWDADVSEQEADSMDDVPRDNVAVEAEPSLAEIVTEQSAIEQAVDDARLELRHTAMLADQPATTEPMLTALSEQIATSVESLEAVAKLLDDSNIDWTKQASMLRDTAKVPLSDAKRDLEQAATENGPEPKEQAVERTRDVVARALEKLDELQQTLDANAKQLEHALKLEELARKQQQLVSDLNENAAADWQEAPAFQKPGVDTVETEDQPTSPAENRANNTEAADQWKRRQQEIADQLASMQQAAKDPADETNKASDALGEHGLQDWHDEQNPLLAHAEKAEKQAEQAKELAKKLEQTDEGRKEPDAQQSLLDQLTDMQQQAEQMANQQVCQSCRDCANGKQSSGTDGKSSKTGEKKSEQPSEQQKLDPLDIAAARQESESAATAPSKEQAKRHAGQAAEKLIELAQQAAKQSGVRKDCDRCKNPGNGRAESGANAGSPPNGTKSVTEESFERLPLRGGTSSSWTRPKRELKNGLLDSREALIPQSYRDIVTAYFEALAKESDSHETDDHSKNEGLR